MRIAFALFFALAIPAYGQSSRLEIAQSVRSEVDLQRLVDSSVGGGRYFRAGESSFYVVDLMPTAGIFSVELLIFEQGASGLFLRLHVLPKFDTDMKAEIVDGVLVISEQPRRENEWKVSIRLTPTESAGGNR